MRKLLICVLGTFFLTLSTKVCAQDEAESYESEKFEYGIFKHLGVGVSASTTGLGVDVATDITKFLGLRAGVSVMPGFNFNTDLDVYVNDAEGSGHSMQVKGGLSRTTVELLLDVHPFGGFFITGGFSFGGSRILKLTGHSDELAGLRDSYIEIDKYRLPVDKDGNVNGEIKVNGFRPYLGIGFGSRAVPKSRLAFRTELGVQIHGKPKVLANGQDVLTSDTFQTGDDFSDIVDKLTFYPVIKFRLSGRIF